CTLTAALDRVSQIFFLANICPKRLTWIWTSARDIIISRLLGHDALPHRNKYTRIRNSHKNSGKLICSFDLIT
ncbi:MAG: hypothetical protein AAFV78_08770, partial [Bacteroidota bacterium]